MSNYLLLCVLQRSCVYLCVCSHLFLYKFVRMNICKLSLTKHDCRRRLTTKSTHGKATTESTATTVVAKTSASSEYENPSFSPQASSHEYQGLFQLPGNANDANETNNYEEIQDKNNGNYMNIEGKV